MEGQPLAAPSESFDVFQFSSANEALNGYLAFQKRKNRYFSISSWAKRMQMPTSGILVNFLKHRRLLSEDVAVKFARDMKLDPAATEFFKTLAYAERAEKAGHDSMALTRNRVSMLRLRARTAVLAEAVVRPISQLKAYLIKEMMNLARATSKPEWVTTRSRLPVQPEEVQVMLDQLVEAGVLVRDEDGAYRNGVQNWETEDGAPSASLRRFHRESLEHAAGTLETVPVGKRYFASYVLPVRTARMGEASEAIDQFVMDFVARFAENRGTADEVYQLNLNYVPLTRPDGPEEK